MSDHNADCSGLCLLIKVTVDLAGLGSETDDVVVPADSQTTLLKFKLFLANYYRVHTSHLEISYCEAESHKSVLTESVFGRLFTNTTPQPISHVYLRFKSPTVWADIDRICDGIDLLLDLLSEPNRCIGEYLSSATGMDQFAFILGAPSHEEDILVPWNTPFSRNNRSYFYLKKQADKLISCFRKLLGTFYHNKVIILMMRYLTLLWNFLAYKRDREYWYGKGAFSIAVEAFIATEEAPMLAYRESLRESCVGVIIQFAEFEDAKMQMVQNTRFIRCFSKVIADCSDLVSGTVHYREQLKFNTLMCLLSSPETHPYFLEHDILSALVNLSGYVVKDVALWYFYSLSVSFLLGYSLPEITKHLHTTDTSLAVIEFLVERVDMFLSSCDYKQQHGFEVDKQYLWITMKPFIMLAWSERTVTKANEDTVIQLNPNFRIETNQYKQPKIMGLWALENLMSSQENMKIIHKELEDFITMLGWEYPVTFALRRWSYCSCNKELPNRTAQPPSLQNICRATFIREQIVSPMLGIEGSLAEVQLAVSEYYSKHRAY